MHHETKTVSYDPNTKGFRLTNWFKILWLMVVLLLHYVGVRTLGAVHVNELVSDWENRMVTPFCSFLFTCCFY